MSDRLGHMYPGDQWAHLVMEHAPTSVSASAVCVAHALGSTHNAKTGLCCPSQETLAKYTRKSRRSVRNGLHGLRDAGLIEVTPRQSPSGPGRTSDAYTLIHPLTKDQILPLGQQGPTGKVRQTNRKGSADQAARYGRPTGSRAPLT